jgi:hypothetical protein
MKKKNDMKQLLRKQIRIFKKTHQRTGESIYKKKWNLITETDKLQGGFG